MVNQYPFVSIVDPRNRAVIDKSRPNDVPNQIIFNALLSSGAVLSYKLHGNNASAPDKKADPEKSTMPTLDWRIFGTHGEIHVTSYDTMLNTWSLNYGPDKLKVEIHNARQGTLTELSPVPDEFQNLPIQARNMARLYEAFAISRGGGDAWYPDLNYGAKKHALLEDMYKENGM